MIRRTALYLSNSTLAWQGRPGQCCRAFPFLTSLLPYRVAFRAARSRSDHTCISNSAADLSIRPAARWDPRNYRSLVAMELS